MKKLLLALGMLFSGAFGERASALNCFSPATKADQDACDEHARSERQRTWNTPAAANSMASEHSAEAVPVLSAGDINKIHSTYEKNQARFARDYKGRLFQDSLVMESVVESFFQKGTYRVNFKMRGSGAFIGDVACDATDEATIKFVTDLDKGDAILVKGVVSDHTMGVIDLEECEMTRAN